MSFPVFIHLGPWSLHPHVVFETLAYFLAFRWYRRQRRVSGDHLPDGTRWSIVAAAAAGAFFGSKLLFWLEDPAATIAHWNDVVFLMGGKTLVGGLVGGLIGVEMTKLWLGVRTSTGDLFALPLAVGIAIGRIGCFLSGLPDQTFGVATRLPWGVDFGDGIVRHPTQIYESVAMLCLAIALWRLTKPPIDAMARSLQPGDQFKLFMVSYMLFRLLVEFIKPEVRFGGLSSIQWVALLTLAYYARDIVRWARPIAVRGALSHGG